MTTAKKLYIETVGCQMNVLDSELVVGSLRRQGYELDPRRRTTPTSSSSTPAPSASTPRTRSTPPSAGCAAHKQQHPDKVIGVLGCMAQKDQEHDPPPGPARRHRLRHRPARAAAGADRARSSATGKPQLRRQPRPRRRRRGTRSTASFESYDPLRDPSMRPTPFQAYVRIQIGCDKFCTYCIVPSDPRPGAEPAPRAHRRRGPAARRRGLQGGHAARPDGQQLPATTTATAARVAAERPARPHPRHAGHRADQVRHQLPART